MSLLIFSKKTEDEIVKRNIRDFELWPFKPSGTLIKPSRVYETKENSKQLMDEFETSMKYIYSFYQTKYTIVQWYIATILGILGNILVTVIFNENIQFKNLMVSSILIILIILFTRLGIIYMPIHSLRRIIIDDYLKFPDGYEKYIDESKIEDNTLKMEVMSSYLSDVITEYGKAVRYCIFKDSLINVLKNSKYIKVNNISVPSEFNPSIDISFSTNLYALLDSNNQEKIKEEFIKLNGAVFNARQNSGVYAYELDENEWRIKGDEFLNNISGIDFEKLVNKSILEIKNSTNNSFKRDIEKRIKNKICAH